MFESTHRFAFFDYFRIPYRVAPTSFPKTASSGPGGQLRRAGGGASLVWLPADSPDVPIDHVARRGRYELRGVTIFARVTPDRVVRPWLAGWGSEWRVAHRILTTEGVHVASVWQDAEGNVFLPFDPGEVMHQFWSEGYQGTGRFRALSRLRPLLIRAYYAMRPLLPRGVQIALRRSLSSVQRRASFPAWPVETALHDFYEWMFGLVVEFAGQPVPWLDLWPDGHSSALVLTHDVETELGYRNLDLLRDIERELGHVSSWNFVPLRYHVDDNLVEKLGAEGCEVGVHGLLHDGRDVSSLRMLRKRLPAMREYALRWGAVGFRSPATQRNWAWMPLLGFDYDSSYHDTAPYEPSPGGSCSYFPYFIDDTVELPITLPQDHTLFTILRHSDEAVWIEKSARIRDCRGMMLVLTHPDYAGDPRQVAGYRRLLETVQDDPTLWRVLPREVSAWWRRRAASTVELGADGWEVRGPASPSGRVAFARPGFPTLASTQWNSSQHSPKM